MSFIDVVKSTSDNHMVEGYIFINLVSFYLFSMLSRYGILCGRALGKSVNISDPIGDVAEDVALLSYGRINIMIVQQPPSDVVIENPTSLLNVKSPCYDTLGPLLKNVAKSYSPVRSMYWNIYKYTKHTDSFSQIRIIVSMFCIKSSGQSWGVIML